VQFDGKPIATGTPGPVYHKLRRAYDRVLADLR